jgi:hypothetical protein
LVSDGHIRVLTDAASARSPRKSGSSSLSRSVGL